MAWRSQILDEFRVRGFGEVRNRSKRRVGMVRWRDAHNKADIRFAEIESAIFPRRDVEARLAIHIHVRGPGNFQEWNLFRRESCSVAAERMPVNHAPSPFACVERVPVFFRKARLREKERV